jgi:PEP-CTERM motif
MHSKGLLALASLLLFGLAGVTSAPAQGLTGSTVTANSWFGGTSSPPGACDPQTNAACNLMDYNTPGGPTNDPLPIVPVAFVEDSFTLTTTSISANTITIVNNFAGPFCSTAACDDVFSGFVFTFAGALPITSVTVDSGSDPNFLPIVGGLTFTPTAIFVNLAGDSPAVGDQLILDVTTNGTTPVPEPSTWALMLLGFAGLGLVGYQRKGAAGRAALTG